MGCTLQSILWKVFHELIFLCFYRKFVLRLVWRALIKTIFASGPFLFWCHSSVMHPVCKGRRGRWWSYWWLCTSILTTQIWLFDNVCCCSFRIFFSFSGASLRLKPFLKAVLHLHTEIQKNFPTMFKLKKIGNSNSNSNSNIVVLHSTGGLTLWYLTETSI